MIRSRFENTDRAAIVEVLKRIGKVRFEKTLENAGLPKATKTANFKLIFQGKVCALNYKYDSQYTQICTLKDYELPRNGWVYEQYRY